MSMVQVSRLYNNGNCLNICVNQCDHAVSHYHLQFGWWQHQSSQRGSLRRRSSWKWWGSTTRENGTRVVHGCDTLCTRCWWSPQNTSLGLPVSKKNNNYIIHPRLYIIRTQAGFVWYWDLRNYSEKFCGWTNSRPSFTGFCFNW